MTIPEPQQRLFLCELAECGNVSGAARAAGVRRRQQLYVLRDRDPEFRRAWDEAMGREPDESHSPRPGRIRVEDLTRKQRRLARLFLASLDEPEEPEPLDIAKGALNAWLAGSPWVLLDDDVAAELRQLSPRAFADYQSYTISAPTPSAGGA